VTGACGNLLHTSLDLQPEAFHQIGKSCAAHSYLFQQLMSGRVSLLDPTDKYGRAATKIRYDCDSLGADSSPRSLTSSPAQRVVYQMPGTNRFVRAEYSAYSSPNCSAIIFSSAPRRSATSTANAITFEKPATQFGITRA